MKRIYAVVPGGLNSVGGMSRMARYYVTEWAEHGRLPEIVVIDSFGPYVKWRMPFHFLLAFLRIFMAALLGRMAVLHVHMAEYGSALRKGILVYLGKLFSIPVVIHLHSAEFVEFCEWLSPKGLNRLVAMLNRADKIIVLGSSWETYLTGRLGLPGTKIVVLRNAVPDPLRSGIAAPPKTEPAPCLLVFLGVLSTRKGMDDLLPALASPELEPLNWRIGIAGNGDIEKYRRLAEDLGIAGRVQFHGWTDPATTEALLAQSDVLVLPSHNEGLPMAIIEAMAHGLTIITTPVGAIQDAITDGENGLLVPVRQPGRLAEILRRTIEDPDLRTRLGAAARARFAAEFELSAFNDRLEIVLQNLVAPAGPSEGETATPRHLQPSEINPPGSIRIRDAGKAS